MYCVGLVSLVDCLDLIHDKLPKEHYVQYG